MTRWDADWFRRLDVELAVLPRLPVDQQREVRRALGADPIAFAMIYMGRHIRSRETGGEVTFAECHFDWARLALTWSQPVPEPASDRHAFIAPRAVGKSTWWFLIFPLWAAAYGHSRFAAAFASAAAQAEGHLGTFKHELETNALLRADFPELCTPARKQGGGTVADRQGMLHTAAGFVFAARGVDSALLGMKVGETRPDLLILDDVEPDEASYSPVLAEKRRGTIVDAIFPLNVYARVVMVGTVTMPGSVMHQCVKVAIGTAEDTEDWVQEERIQPHYSPAILTGDDGARRSIWPEKWSLAFLESIEHTRQYAKNYRNDPMGRDGSYWNMEDFRYGDLPGTTRTALFVDPAVTARKTSDFTGLAVVSWRPPARGARDDPGAAVVRDARGVRLTGRPLRDYLVKLLKEHPEIRLVVVEVNQGGEVWLDVFGDLPVKVKTHVVTESKEIRFAAALDHYQRGRVSHARRLPAAEEQMVAFPKGAYDDVADAVSSGVLYFLEPEKKIKAGARGARAYQ